VIFHPLLEVGLALRSVGRRCGTHGRRLLSGPGFGTGLGTLCGSGGMILLSVLLSKAAGKDRRSCKQHEECRAEGEPGWTMRFHNESGQLTSRNCKLLMIDYLI
jgi:hypothetical protein